MSLDEFLQELSAAPTRFCLDGDLIRTENKCYCPITEIARLKGEVFNTWQAHRAGVYIGLGLDEINEIVNAADISDMTEMRAKLLEACHLTSIAG